MANDAKEFLIKFLTTADTAAVEKLHAANQEILADQEKLAAGPGATCAL